jgi:hypothetical protein
LRDAPTTARKTAGRAQEGVDDLKKQQEETEEAKACLELDKLMKEVWTVTNPVPKQLVWKTKSHKIEIRLPTGYSTPGGGRWTFQEATCHLSSWVEWKHFRSRFSGNMISTNRAYTQNGISRKAAMNTYN